MPDAWCLRCGFSLVESARDVTRLLFSPAPADRPDGLIVADDNFTEQAIAGVLETGCRIPQDVTVVSHWNFPLPAPQMVPIHTAGPDARLIIDAGIKFCQHLRQRPDDREPRAIDCCHTGSTSARQDLSFVLK